MTAKSAQKIHQLPFYGSKEGNDIGILLDSKVVVEKKSYVSTGVLTYVLGDFIEVEMPQFDEFRLGEQVKLIVYTKSGMFVFESTVVAKDKGSLIIINPPSNQKKFIEKREHPRVSTAHTGLLHAVHHFNHNSRLPMEVPVHFAVNNISMGGLGIVLEDDLGFQKISRLEMELDLGFSLRCLTEIIRSENSAQGTFYGVRYIDLSKEETCALRAFILKIQVEDYYKQKKQDKFNEQISKNKLQRIETKVEATGLHINQ
ncbi:flagellar brake protein [Paenibacillus abyssi]|uniref:PilZ domain-containing protein n=1 Tax=Paenibacillus abyssi TaxID=1340531 RepID=A0A917G7H4_9BACL|nr:PilZ domain-containing protein [Paenibacillus abyssi]GGG26455.1 hypothetical protein GCM10010916_48560 [Paenibacillus abyssi]